MEIAGWTVKNDDGLYVAKRPKSSVYQRENGARDEISTRNYNELIILIDAYNTFSRALDSAERLYEEDIRARRERFSRMREPSS